MNILLVILHAQTARGGAERYTRDLAAQLLARGHTVATAATSFDPDWPGEQLTLPTPALTRLGKYSQFLHAVERLRQSRPTYVLHAMLPVLNAHLYHPHAGVMALPKRSGLTELMNLRRRRMGTIETQLVNKTLTIALSNYSLSHFRRAHPTAPAEVLLNGIDLTRFNPDTLAPLRNPTRQSWGVAPHEIALLCVAQDFARKGVPIAVEALAKLPADSNLKLIIVGRDDPRPITKLARTLGVTDRVVIAGPMQDVRPAYAAADLFILPTRHDPCPLVTLEALACGLPVISTTFNGACEYMTPGLHGEVVAEVTPDAIAAALGRYLSTDARTKAHAACLELRPQLDVDKHVHRLVEIYARLQREVTTHVEPRNGRTPRRD